LPWPNRLADGRYTFGGQELQLPIDEVARGNANHGLTRWLNWSPASQASDRVQLDLVLHPRPGYPFTLQLSIDYVLSEAGLTVRTTARNLGTGPLPFGAGQHPYLTVGTASIDSATLHLPAQSRLDLDADRRLPTGRMLPLHDTEHDFRVARPIGPLHLDDCFAQLERDPDGRAHVALGSPRTDEAVVLWMDQHYRYVQVFSGDTLAPGRRRRGLAIEPMTCPPNAFSTETDLIVLQPDETVSLEWGLVRRLAPS
jgi:galactose mutarotase-like enzyme